ncbi:hypothetical protein BBP40_005433 [Aspergillus hancockii]|nr:hypothetical protein BBP40_005433 [Aspergillus hancockii]
MTHLGGSSSCSCITEEGGTWKFQIPKDIAAAMDIIERKDEILLMAPNGAATDTYHTSLGTSSNPLQKT